MSHRVLAALRQKIDAAKYESEQCTLKRLLHDGNFTSEECVAFSNRAVGLVESIRDYTKLGMMEVFLAEYGLQPMKALL